MKVQITSSRATQIEQVLNSNKIIGDEVERKSPSLWSTESFIQKDMALDFAEELVLNLKAFNLRSGSDYTVVILLD